MRFLHLIRPVMCVLPEVASPDRKVCSSESFGVENAVRTWLVVVWKTRDVETRAAQIGCRRTGTFSTYPFVTRLDFPSNIHRKQCNSMQQPPSFCPYFILFSLAVALKSKSTTKGHSSLLFLGSLTQLFACFFFLPQYTNAIQRIIKSNSIQII